MLPFYSRRLRGQVRGYPAAAMGWFLLERIVFERVAKDGPLALTRRPVPRWIQEGLAEARYSLLRALLCVAAADLTVGLAHTNRAYRKHLYSFVRLCASPSVCKENLSKVTSSGFLIFALFLG